jgi:hypothetical protein
MMGFFDGRHLLLKAISLSALIVAPFTLWAASNSSHVYGFAGVFLFCFPCVVIAMYVTIGAFYLLRFLSRRRLVAVK